MDPVLKGYFQLARPANLPTAAADIFAGVAISGFLFTDGLTGDQAMAFCLLVFSSIFLYAGGVVLNDVFDHKVDSIERPERPIPSQRVPVRAAAVYGAILLVLGIVLAFLVNPVSGFLAITLAFFIVLYDAVAKKHAFFGPLNMGLCRGLNLVLGISFIGIVQYWWFAAIPITYIFAITLISRGEVNGQNKSHIIWASILYAFVIMAAIMIIASITDNLVYAMPFLFLFAFLVYRPLLKAYRENSPANIKKAVISGVLSLIVLDAALSVGFSVWWYGLLLLLLLPLSVFLSKLFAVT